MQDCKQRNRLTTSDNHLPPGRSFFAVRGYTFAAFCFLHLAILVTAGYFIVQWQLPAATKLAFLAVACFASLWLFSLRTKHRSVAQGKNGC